MIVEDESASRGGLRNSKVPQCASEGIKGGHTDSIPTEKQQVMFLAGGLIQRLNELKRQEENANRRWTPGGQRYYAAWGDRKTEKLMERDHLKEFAR